jgi:hypothetical protein
VFVIVKLTGNEFSDLGIVAPEKSVAYFAIESLADPIKGAATELVNVGWHYRKCAFVHFDARGAAKVEVYFHPHRP